MLADLRPPDDGPQFSYETVFPTSHPREGGGVLGPLVILLALRVNEWRARERRWIRKKEKTRKGARELERRERKRKEKREEGRRLKR